MTNLLVVDKYRLDTDLWYDPESHMWVAPCGDNRARLGFDPLGAETAGDVVALSFEPVGTRVERGAAFGSLEAAKFVGPLIAPVAGTVAGHNGEVLAQPARVNLDPLGTWLVELAVMDLEGKLGRLLRGDESLGEWFAAEVERFRRKGSIAE